MVMLGEEPTSKADLQNGSETGPEKSPQAIIKLVIHVGGTARMLVFVENVSISVANSHMVSLYG